MLVKIRMRVKFWKVKKMKGLREREKERKREREEEEVIIQWKLMQKGRGSI